jgi:CubicO group peptidase (beta-lactamase class C family)
MRRRAPLAWIAAQCALASVIGLIAEGHATPVDWRDPAALVALDRELDALRTQHGLVGAAAALIDRDGTVHVWTAGDADRDAGRAVTRDTPFRVGSISKTFTAFIAQRLAVRGQIDLDARVADLAPEFAFANAWAAEAPVRVAHLLEHTSGLDDNPYADYRSGERNAPAAPYARRTDPPRRSHWPPGEYWRYSNVGPTLAAAVLERASGRDFDALVESELVAPLGLRATSFRDDAAFATRVSRSYRNGGATGAGTASTTAAPVDPWRLPMRASGAAVASIDDLAIFATVLLRGGDLPDGRTVLPREAVARMQAGRASRAARVGLDSEYGLGLFQFARGGRLWTGHWGKVDGFLASFGVRPDDARGFVLLVNTASGRGRDALMDRLVAHLVADLAPVARAPIDPAAVAAVAPAAGWYRNAAPERALSAWPQAVADVLRITPSDEGLVVRGWLRADEHYRALSGGRLLGDFADRATAVWVPADATHPDDEFIAGTRYVRVAAWRVFAERLTVVAVVLVAALAGLRLAWRCVGVVWPRARGIAWPLAVWPAVAGAAAVLLPWWIVVDVLFGEGGLDASGQPGAWSQMVRLTSLALPVAALVSVAVAWRGAASRVRPSRRRDRVFAAVAGAVLLVYAAWLARYGWIGVATWRD